MPDPKTTDAPITSADIEHLLDELDVEAIDDPAPTKPQAAPAPAAPAPVKPTKAKSSTPAPTPTLVAPAPPVQNQTLGAPTQPKIIPPPDNKGGELSDKILVHYDNLQTKIWDQLNSDRSLIDEYIKLFKDRIEDPEATKQYYVEALTSLIVAKSTTSANASKLLDSCAKMAAAIKHMKVGDIGNNSLLAQLLGPNSESDFDPNRP